MTSFSDTAYSARDRASKSAHVAGDRGHEALDSAPLSVLGGGLAVGLLVGSLLPRGRREAELLAPLGRQIALRATAAIRAAREAGLEQLDELGVNREHAKDKGRQLLDSAAKAASTAGDAAKQAARDPESA